MVVVVCAETKLDNRMTSTVTVVFISILFWEKRTGYLPFLEFLERVRP
jgi:hypothetical protein